jgi:phage-related protein
VRGTLAPGERPVVWAASSKKDLLAMPRPVVRDMGMAISAAQMGGKSPSANPWKGEGPGVMEIVSTFDSNAFRAVYTVKFKRRFMFSIASRRNLPGESKRPGPMSIQ